MFSLNTIPEILYTHTHLVLLYSNIKTLNIIWQTLQLDSRQNKSTRSPLTIFSEACMPYKEHHLSSYIAGLLRLSNIIIYEAETSVKKTLNPRSSSENLHKSKPKGKSPNPWNRIEHVTSPYPEGCWRSRWEENTNVRPYLSYYFHWLLKTKFMVLSSS